MDIKKPMKTRGRKVEATEEEAVSAPAAIASTRSEITPPSSGAMSTGNMMAIRNWRRASLTRGRERIPSTKRMQSKLG